MRISNHRVEEIINFVKKEKIDLTVVGPEGPLVDGIVDEFNKHDLKIFGPNKLAAQLEGSKDFCKKILNSGKVLTAKHETFSDAISFQKWRSR